jgi:hypothetical protein
MIQEVDRISQDLRELDGNKLIIISFLLCSSAQACRARDKGYRQTNLDPGRAAILHETG